MQAPPPPSRNVAKRVAFGVVSAALVLMTILPAAQVLLQALRPEVVSTPLSCREGTALLLQATERARLTAQSRGTQTTGEVLDAFRTALTPEWKLRPAIFEKCTRSGDPLALEALRTVVFLRYAEERAVRAESPDLARLRVSAPGLVERLRP